jgi:hypothetical protein
MPARIRPSFLQVTNATITVVVTDPGGAAIAGAHVRVQNLSTNSDQTVEINNSGVYTVGQFPQIFNGRVLVVHLRSTFSLL